MEKLNENTLQFAAEKIGECEFFIGLMEQYRTEPQKFGFYLSATLSALYSILERLIHTVGDRRLRRERENTVARLMQSSPEVYFLVKARNKEVHREGVRIARARRSGPLLPKHRVPRIGTRYNRFDDPLWTGPGRGTPKHWVFCEKSKSEAITLCRNGLKQVQRLVGELAETGKCAKPG